VSASVLERRVFSVSRAADFLEPRALVSQTGQPGRRFGEVVVKELLDNALDAAETADVAPEIVVTVVSDAGDQRLTVEDNGPGIPAVVAERVLDFTTLTSDKALYRSPCRGAQGNALKTIIGIPHALGVADPVVIEARGVRHVIRISLDAAGNLELAHDRADSLRRTGTQVTVPLPAGLDLNAANWVAGYALVNPHASFSVIEHAHDREGEQPGIYKATAGDRWRKPMPADPTSPWWYDKAAFTKLAASLAVLGDDRPLGEFIREFKGLSGTAKRKAVAARVPGIRRVRDLAERPDACGHLLEAMREASAESNVTSLGQVPEAHCRELLDQLYGVDRFWYRHGGIVHDGVPWHIEVAVAHTQDRGGMVWAANYAISFGDPLGSTRLSTAEVAAYGAESFLSYCDAMPNMSNDHRRAAVIHVTCAAPVFTDKGKTRLDVPDAVAEAFARILWQGGKDLYREKRQADRADRAERRAADQARRAAARTKMTKKEAVFAVIPEAVRQQRDGTDLPFSAHSLFYKIRPLFLRLLPAETLAASYCEQALIPAYEREHGPITGMYREPRGELHEPHDPDGLRTVPLGTLQVAGYVPPTWTYDKILVVEKAGLWPVLKKARIADRYDIAVGTSEGFAAEAPRDLLAELAGRDMTIFVLHDADHHGYNIARTLGEETERMPGHHIDVIDLGLTVDAAIELGMDPEPYTRESALPARLIPRLTDAARQWFTGTVIDRDYHGNPKKWRCKRVELDAFTSPGLIAYIEDGLRAHGADQKVVPPGEVLTSNARACLRADVTRQAEQIIGELIDIPALAAQVAGETAAQVDFTIDPDAIRDRLEADRTQPWAQAVAAEMAARRRNVDIHRRVAELLEGRWIGGTA
jgi:hypothetical protein